LSIQCPNNFFPGNAFIACPYAAKAMTKSMSTFKYDPCKYQMLGNWWHYHLDEIQNMKEAFCAAQPFPHIVIDNFLDNHVITAVANEFDLVGSGVSPSIVQNFYGVTENKRASLHGDSCMGGTTRALINFLNSYPFLCFLNRLTGTSEILLPDPYLEGAGLHESTATGYLKIHVDLPRHGLSGLDRRLNLLIYLTPNWEESFNGDLQLWSENMNQCSTKIYPFYNRAVIFKTANDTFHGLPDPIQCPSNLTRKSIALYYYSNGRSDGASAETLSISNMFKERPNESFMQLRIKRRLALIYKAMPFLSRIFF
jgi:hypothetical protein